jgi:hypothetical protein
VVVDASTISFHASSGSGDGIRRRGVGGIFYQIFMAVGLERSEYDERE